MSDTDLPPSDVNSVIDDLASLHLESVRVSDPSSAAVQMAAFAADAAQTLLLQKIVCGVVSLLLFLELWGLFMIVVWQGRGHFHLDPVVFGMITGGVLIQTFFSFRTIVTHLYPKGGKDFAYPNEKPPKQ